MTTFRALVDACRKSVGELFPWDLAEALAEQQPLLLLDVREPYEFEAVAIQGSLNVPRGILEPSCEYGFEETLPELVQARDRSIVIVCRSGNRSLLAGQVMKLMGYRDVRSLATGLKGWNDYDQPLYDLTGKPVDADSAELLLSPPLSAEQLGTAG